MRNLCILYAIEKYTNCQSYSARKIIQLHLLRNTHLYPLLRIPYIRVIMYTRGAKLGVVKLSLLALSKVRILDIIFIMILHRYLQEATLNPCIPF